MGNCLKVKNKNGMIKIDDEFVDDYYNDLLIEDNGEINRYYNGYEENNYDFYRPYHVFLKEPLIKNTWIIIKW